MVVSRQTHTRCETTIHLALVFLALIAVTGCEPHPERTVVQLHFKSGEQVESLLEYLLKETVDYQVVGNTVVFDANQEEIKPALEVIQSLDKPPVAYELRLTANNIRSYSTSRSPNSLHLVEGKTTTTQFNGNTLQITVNKANDRQSLVHILSQNKKGVIHENHWLLPHNKNSNPDPRIFPKGITLTIQK